jgi:hypothetical protein
MYEYRQLQQSVNFNGKPHPHFLELNHELVLVANRLELSLRAFAITLD